MADEKDPKDGTAEQAAAGTTAEGEGQKPKWETLGFDSEDAFIEAFTSARDEAAKLATTQEELASAKAARDRLAKDFQRQSTEIGQLRKRASESRSVSEPEKSDDDVLDSVTSEEATALDKFLDEHTDLKTKVAQGGKPAMAQAVKSYREHLPIDLKAPVFSHPKKARTNTEQQSVEDMIKAAFEKMNKTEASSLPATSEKGAVPEAGAVKKPTNVLGAVDVNFFKGKSRE